MKTRTKPKKRPLDRSPPSIPQKLSKKEPKDVNYQIGSSFPSIESLKIKESPSNPIIGNSLTETSHIPTIKPILMNLKTKEPINIIPNFSTKVNTKFICRPKDQNPYEHLRRMSGKPYDFSFESSQ